MLKFNKKERKIITEIASFYGCKVKFSDYQGGRWMGKYIEVGEASSYSRLISLFCHELGHFMNWKTGKYELYHNHDKDGLVKILGSYDKMIHYSLQAEIYTEKVGKEICKTWFPNTKYRTYYVNRRYCKEFLYGYYLG